MPTEDLVVRASLRDELSRPIQKNRDELGRFVKEVEGADRAAGKASSGGLSRFQGGLSRLHGLVGRVTGGVQSFAARLSGPLVSGLRRVGTGFSTLLKIGGAAIAALAGAALVTGYQRLTSIQDATAALTVSLGSAGAAGDLLAQVLDVVRGTPFNFDQFASAAQQLVGFGVDASKVPGYLTAIGEASATQGKRAGEFADRLSGIFGQIAATGQLDLGSVWQISETGVNALAILANHFGVTRDAMKEMISDGAVPAGEALDALASGIMNGSEGLAGVTPALAGTMDRLRDTLSGAAGGFRAALARVGAAIITPFTGALTTGLGLGGDILDTFGERVGTTMQGIADRFQPVIDRARRLGGRLADALGGGEVTHAAKILDRIVGAGGNLSPVLLEVYRTVRLVGRVIGDVLVPAFAGLAGTAWDNLSPLGLIRAVLRLLVRHAEDLVPVVQGVIIALGGAALIAHPWLALIGLFALAYNRSEAFRDIIADVVAWGKRAGQAFGDWLGSLNLEPLLDAWRKNKTMILAVGAAAAFLFTIPGAIAGIVAGLVLLWQRNETFRESVKAVGSFIVETLVPGILSAVGAIGRFFVRLWQDSRGVREAIGDVVLFIIQDLVPGVIRVGAAIGRGFMTAVRAIRSAWNATRPLRNLIGSVLRLAMQLGRLTLAPIIGAVRIGVALFRVWWQATTPVREALVRLGGLALSGIIGAVRTVVRVLRDVWDRSRGVRETLVRWGGMGLNTIRGAIDAIADAIGTVVDLLESAVDWVSRLDFSDIPGAGVLGDIASGIGGLIPGDTATTRLGHRAPHEARARHHELRHLAGRAGGHYRVTSAYRPGGSGDHARGAVDVTGSRLGALAKEVRSAGGFAELHGSDGSRHLHAVPAIGDTSSSRIGGGGGRDTGTTVIVQEGAVQVLNPASTVDVVEGVAAGLANWERDRHERSLTRED